MRPIRFAALVALIALIPSTSAAPVAPVTALAPVEIWADGFGSLRGLAVDGDGVVYVADRDAGTVTRIGSDRAQVLVAEGLDRPIGLAFDASGRLLVAEERAGRVIRVEMDGRRTVVVAAIQQPRWLSVAPDGTVYISARSLVRDGGPEPDDESLEPQVILQLSATGRLTEFAGGFIGLQGLYAEDRAVYAAAVGIQGVPSAEPAVFAVERRPDGAAGAITVATAFAGVARPIGVAADRLDAVFSSTVESPVGANPPHRTVVKVTPEGQSSTLASNLAGPAGLGFDASGNLFVADGAAGRVLKLHAPAGPSFGSLPAYTRQSPMSVSITTEPGTQVLVSATGQPTASAIADPAGNAVTGVQLALNSENTLTAWAIGADGQGLVSNAAETSVTHDDAAPSIAIQAPAATFVGRVVAIQAQITDTGSGVAGVGLDIDGQPLTASLSPTPPAANLATTATWNAVADGVHTLTAIAVDRAGNTRSVTRTFTVDTTAPTTQIVHGPARIAEGAAATFSFTGSDNLTPTDALAFSWRIDGGPWGPYAVPTTAVVSGLPPGAHRFEVRARDLAGNEDPRPAERGFAVVSGSGELNGQSGGDFALTVAPGSASVVPGSITTFGVTASGLTRPTGTVGLSVTGLPVGVSATFVPPRLAPGQLGQLVVRAAIDAAANTQAFVIGATVDTEAGKRSATATASLTVLAGGRTALVGRVVDTDRQPLAGVAVMVENLVAYTDANGNVLLLDPPAGDQVVLIDGATASAPGRRYPTIPMSVNIVAGQVNELPYLPHLHRQHERFTLIHPTEKTVATDPDLPGVALHLDGDNKIIGWDGQPADRVSIRTVPIDRLPVKPIPPDVKTAKIYMFYFGKRGGGIPQRPVPFEAPNELGLSPGAKALLWYFDESPRQGEAPNDWRVAGTGTVSDDGLMIRTDTGVGIPKFCCGAVYYGAINSPNALRPGLTAQRGQAVLGADPVDLSTGIFMLSATDLMIPGRIPIVVRRSYRSGDTNVGPFGFGTSLNYQDMLQITSASILTYLYENDARTEFVQQPNGTFTNSTVPAFRGVTISVNADGTRTLRYKDGRSVTFGTGLYGSGIPIRLSDANGNTVTIMRDGSTNPVAVNDDATGRGLMLTWQLLAARVTKVVDSAGRTVLYDYDASNRLVSVTNPAGGVTRYAYDGNYRMTSITDARGITYLTNSYDVNSRVCQQTQADSGAFTMYYVTADIATTPASLQLLDEAARGGPITQAPCSASASSSPVVATVLVDPRGHPTTYRFSSAGELVGVTDALGQTTTSTRDPATNLVQAVTDPLNRTTQYTYDAAGNVLTATRLAGTPDAVTTTYTYESTFNRVTSLRDPLNHTTSFGYDSHGNLTSVTDPLANRTTIAYNATGDPTSVTDPLTNVTTFTYDPAGNLATIADPLGHTTTRTYDAVSRLISQTTPLGFTTKLTYDALNRVRSIRDPKNGLTQFTYDPNGNLTSLTDALSHTTAYTYDAMDRVATRTDPLGHSESFGYDLNGNLSQHTDRKGQGATFSYDALNRRTGASYADATVSYSYDAVGRLTQATDSVGGTISNVWGALDRLTSQTQPQGTVSYTYDAVGRRTTMTVPGQAVISYSYDNANRLTAMTQGTSLVQFAYDAASRRTTLTLPNGITTEYGYDAASQLTSLTYKLGTTVLGDLQYTYDAAGQRIQVGGNWARTGLPQAVTSATYNANNQQVTFGGQTLTYDLNGNLTSDGTNTYTWDARDRLIGLAGPVPASFLYDPAGRRARKTINGTATDFVYDDLNPVLELSGGATTSLLVGLWIDEYFVRVDTSGPSTFLSDALGSTVALTNAAGVVQTEYTYEPFGATTTAGTTNSNPIDYAGREADGTGLKYNRARYYHPGLQRFINVDPLDLGSGDLNLYAYVHNNPVGLTDRLGLKVDLSLVGRLREPLEQVKRTRRGKELYDILEQSKVTYKIREYRIGDPCRACYIPKTREIIVDPTWRPAFQTPQGYTSFSIPRIVGHEMGHAATGASDFTGPEPGTNVILNENPIAVELGEPPRIRY